MEGVSNYRARKLALISRYIIGSKFRFGGSIYKVLDYQNGHHSSLNIIIHNSVSGASVNISLKSFCEYIINRDFVLIIEKGDGDK